MTPAELAKELSISPKTLRSYLRRQYGKLSEQSRPLWELDSGQVERARAHFGGTSRQPMGATVPSRSIATHGSADVNLTASYSAYGWEHLLTLPRVLSVSIHANDVPPAPGLYAWFRDEECIYVGISGDLQKRLSDHRDQRHDLSRSTFRSWVAVELLGVERAMTRQRPSVMTEAQVQTVNEWISECHLTWMSLASRESAVALEAKLLSERRPSFNAR